MLRQRALCRKKSIEGFISDGPRNDVQDITDPQIRGIYKACLAANDSLGRKIVGVNLMAQELPKHEKSGEEKDNGSCLDKTFPELQFPEVLKATVEEFVLNILIVVTGFT